MLPSPTTFAAVRPPGVHCRGLCIAPAAAAAFPSTGGAQFVPPPPPPKKAKIVNGRAIAPAGAPLRVKHAMSAANRIVRKPYVYGGGHGAFTASLASGYDCSGAVSYALHGGRFLARRWPRAI